jgi:TetR/AcrR family transcriptional repressor of bet genes
MGKKRIRDIRHDELIEAAIRGVHTHGYACVTMTEIAELADSTAASISYYFGSKEKLVEATMLRLLGILRHALLIRLETAKTPYERLIAIVDANYDDALFTSEQTSVWVQFWSHAPYAPALARLQNINRSRVRSHFRNELKQICAPEASETVRRALQAYMDGVWLEASQSNGPLNAKAARQEARRVVKQLLNNPDLV